MTGGNVQPIEYWNPVGWAWKRMVDILFRPFNIEKWFVMGFAAFIAGSNLGGGGGNGGGNSFSSDDFTSSAESSSSGDWSFPDFWAEYAPVVIPAVVIIILILFALFLLFAWLKARGTFIFLDNVVQNQAAIVEPWKKYRKQGNSLFWWNLAVGFIAVAILLMLAVACALMVWPMFTNQTNIPMGIIGIVFGITALLMYGLFFGYLGMFVHDFVAPVMMKHDLRIREAWGMFGPLLKENWGKFLLYGLVRYLVLIGVNMAYFAICLLTCCCFLLLTVIPYLGTVLLLPAHVFIRLLGPEFLQQFGDDFTLETDTPENNVELTIPPPAPEPESI